MINKNEELARSILDLVGGEKNISSVTNCVTRLRFILKDQSLAQEDEIKKLAGVMGIQSSNGQFQIIIGTGVKKVFEAVCKIGNLENVMRKQQDVSTPTEKKTFKTIFNSVITNVSSSIIPALPIFICSGLLKAVLSIFGPMMLGVLSADSGLYTILSFASDAGFYFLPIYLGYTSAKQFKANPYIGMLMGAVLVSPVFVNIFNEGGSLDIFGIPVIVVPYSNSVIPIILIVWVMSYVEKFFVKVIPEILHLTLVPLCTALIMIPLALCALAPIGFILGGYLSSFFLGINDVLGPFGIAVIAVALLPLIMTGMHHVLNMTAVAAFLTVGYDSGVFVAYGAGIGASIGTALAFAIKSKKIENKSIGFTSLISQALGGVIEPLLYGVLLPHRKTLLGCLIGALAGGLYLGITETKVFALAGSNILVLISYVGENPMNFINGVIGTSIAAVLSFIATWIIGFEE